MKEFTVERKWKNAPFNELADYAAKEHHGFLYENLTKISKLLTLILKVHGDNHPELSDVNRLFYEMKTEINR